MFKRMMLRTARPIALVLAATALAACRPAAPEGQGSAAARPSTPRDSVPPSAIRRPSSPGQGTPSPSTPIPPTARRTQPMERGSETLSVSALLARPVPHGQRVVVSGSCLDQFHARGSGGGPPVSRSDWQLAEGDQVIYVVGRYPAACSAGPVVLSVIAEVDTIAVAGTRRPRQYLVVPR